MVPSRLDFEKRNGKWILTDWTQAEDGSYYADSIKKMCDGDNALAKKMISYDSDACQMLLWQNMIYYMKANYGGMELPIYFDSYMDEENIKKISKFIDITPTYDEERMFEPLRKQGFFAVCKRIGIFLFDFP